MRSQKFCLVHVVELPFETPEDDDGFIYLKRKHAACGEGRYTVAVVQVPRVLLCHDVTHKWYINGTINFMEVLLLGFTRSLWKCSYDFSLGVKFYISSLRFSTRLLRLCPSSK